MQFLPAAASSSAVALKLHSNETIVREKKGVKKKLTKLFNLSDIFRHVFLFVCLGEYEVSFSSSFYGILFLFFFQSIAPFCSCLKIWQTKVCLLHELSSRVLTFGLLAGDDNVERPFGRKSAQLFLSIVSPTSFSMQLHAMQNAIDNLLGMNPACYYSKGIHLLIYLWNYKMWKIQSFFKIIPTLEKNLKQ